MTNTASTTATITATGSLNTDAALYWWHASRARLGARVQEADQIRPALFELHALIVNSRHVAITARASDAIEDITRTLHAMPERSPYRPGEHVWWWRGEEDAVEAVVMGVDGLTGRYHVAEVADRHRQRYVCAHEIAPRYAGEPAPGVAARRLADEAS